MNINWTKALDIGSRLAGAYGAYDAGKRAAKIEKEKLNYQIQSDKEDDIKTAVAQNELDESVATAFGSKKRKKTKQTQELFDQAYDTQKV